MKKPRKHLKQPKPLTSALGLLFLVTPLLLDFTYFTSGERLDLTPICTHLRYLNLARIMIPSEFFTYVQTQCASTLTPQAVAIMFFMIKISIITLAVLCFALPALLFQLRQTLTKDADYRASCKVQKDLSTPSAAIGVLAFCLFLRVHSTMTATHYDVSLGGKIREDFICFILFVSLIAAWSIVSRGMQVKIQNRGLVIALLLFIAGLGAYGVLTSYESGKKPPADRIGKTEYATNFRNSSIALDLNGDGIRYTALDGNHTFFDIDGDKFAEHVEWLNKNDGFLVRDLNGNGKIDSVKEMFGDNGGTSAYAKLAKLDSNHDGKIDAHDSGFAALRIWRDANGNGKVDAGEMKTLAQMKIASLSLQETSATMLDGHAVSGTSSFTYTNGITRTAADVLFETDQLNSWYVGDGSAASTTIDRETLFLPMSRGYGTLPSLHNAMTQDHGLKLLMQRLVDTDISIQMQTVYDQVSNIVLRWAGATKLDPHANDHVWTEMYGINPQKIAVLERMTGLPFTGNSYTHVDYAYAQLMNQMLDRLLVKGPLHQVFSHAHYNFVEDKIVLGDTLGHILNAARAHVPANAAAKITYWNEIARAVTYAADEFGMSVAQLQAKVDAYAGFKTYVVTISGTSGNDVLRSLDDTRGPVGHEVYAGFLGDDIYGTTGVNTILYNIGDGNDTIYGYGTISDNTLAFGVGITLANLHFTHDHDGLRIHTPGNGSILVAREYGQSDGLNNYSKLKFVFSDGSSATLDQIQKLTLKQNNTSGNDSTPEF